MRLQRFIYRDFDPLTKSLILIAGLVYLLSMFLSGLLVMDLPSLMALTPDRLWPAPWTLLTYPLVNSDVISLIFAGLWLWYVGGALERSWGGGKYAWFLFLTTGITGLAMGLTGSLFHVSAWISGLWLPLVGITWAWANLHPHQEMLFWGIIPMKAVWLAWLQAALTFLGYLQITHNLFFSVASLVGIVVAIFFGNASNRRERGGSERNYRASSYRQTRRSRLRVIK